MPAERAPADASDQAVSKLNASLKSCHKVVKNYRAALLKTPNAVPQPPESD